VPDQQCGCGAYRTKGQRGPIIDSLTLQLAKLRRAIAGSRSKLRLKSRMRAG